MIRSYMRKLPSILKQRKTVLIICLYMTKNQLWYYLHEQRELTIGDQSEFYEKCLHFNFFVHIIVVSSSNFIYQSEDFPISNIHFDHHCFPSILCVNEEGAVSFSVRKRNIRRFQWDKKGSFFKIQALSTRSVNSFLIIFDFV